jgi:aerobic-type carbon monoxide dehydrogenase small subunit (CoxS/CutS family)
VTRFTVNGRVVEVETSARPLLDVLRDELGLFGTKEGCGEGECGACSVLIGDRVVNSCLVPVCQVEGEIVTTVEGLAREGMLSPLQRAFVEEGAAQCGICTPGFLLAAEALLREKPSPTADEVRVALAGNLCRCTGYRKIVEAVLAAPRSGHGRAP